MDNNKLISWLIEEMVLIVPNGSFVSAQSNDLSRILTSTPAREISVPRSACITFTYLEQ
jgi:hypothetical protein